eukprot:TRINITY_DN14184_c0_g1_i1.p1 TRINITY_DN14184_c0_g1~~TRINITY_DN14184_c0_g1_i1.p1  ORF type:complete len:233 (+),score=28.53 TRINITY_DN14184_c0_g1_i1:532-1230(+)
MKDEIVRLGTTYNLATTYTSFLAVEERRKEGESEEGESEEGEATPKDEDEGRSLFGREEKDSAALDEILSGVKHIKEMGSDISSELLTHDILLNESSGSRIFSRRPEPIHSSDMAFMSLPVSMDCSSSNSSGCCSTGGIFFSSSPRSTPAELSHPKSHNYKVIVVGEMSVGKTSVCVRCTQGIFLVEYKATIGADFMTKDIELDGEIFKLQIWDTSWPGTFSKHGAMYMTRY